ncbi:nucleotidyltransferase domain-containing protein [Pseudomonas viridiflava]|uniref:nucleotidyltransferase domain-containing protein n=1 Tax=Pseudomonas viridiflava TaxID=33069 RepID=UPI000F010907|nr:nucleotidyltransferase domain-containing protein [Pseudomonas viridiflava]
MARKSLPVNVTRQLWAQCGGFCQNPHCNKPLFANIGDDVVSLVNVAHIIGHGADGPRSEHQLANAIERDGIDNLIMLCLDCHKIVDELEARFSVELMQQWKHDHASRIRSLFQIARFTDEQRLLRAVNDLLDENHLIFTECGPYSAAVVEGASGDALVMWRRRCLDTILPNNKMIVDLIETNKGNFAYPWEVYTRMLMYKLHAEAFQDNCLSGKRVNDYKQFPKEFDHFVKTKLEISVPSLDVIRNEELEYRRGQIETYINRFLKDHGSIARLQELNRATMVVELNDGRSLRVFVTNTYYFTNHTLDRVLEIDPSVDAIICSCPAGEYVESAKAECIQQGIGLFMLGEFMGAIRLEGEAYLNFLVRADKEQRVRHLGRLITELRPALGVSVYAFGSYLRRKVYNDIDLIIVYRDAASKVGAGILEGELVRKLQAEGGSVDITVASAAEYASLTFDQDNRTKVFPLSPSR